MKLNFLSKTILLFFSILIFAMSRNAFLFVLIAALPVLICIFIGNNLNKYISGTICAFNLMGILSFCSNLLRSQDIDSAAFEYLTDPYVWFVIYGTTSLGWFTIWLIPSITAKFFIYKAENKVNSLEKQIAELTEEWGEEVKSESNYL